MRRREEIIAVIADATAAGSRRFLVTDRATEAWRDAFGWDHPYTRELETERITAVEELRGAWGRVQIRFAPDSDVRQRLDNWREALDQYSDTVRSSVRDGIAYMPQIREVRRDATLAADQWLDAARTAVDALDRGETSGGV